MRDRTKLALRIVASIVSVGIGLLSALQMQGRVRMVDILTLFAAGMAAGVSLRDVFAALLKRSPS